MKKDARLTAELRSRDRWQENSLDARADRAISRAANTRGTERRYLACELKRWRNRSYWSYKRGVGKWKSPESRIEFAKQNPNVRIGLCSHLLDLV